MTTGIEAKVRKEVEALHGFFVEWFSGAIPSHGFDADFVARFDSEFILIPPAGSLVTFADFASSVQRAHGSNSSFRIAIRNVKVQRVLDGYVLATYEEWQRNALASKPPDNARIASVVFKNDEPLKWLHIHETWMPESAPGSYDF